jgi:hypothetical protein
MDAQQATAGATIVERLRRWILAVLVLGLLGTVTELILLEHYEKPVQFVPVVLIALALAVIVWHVMKRGAGSRFAFVAVMALFVLAGFAGFAAHFIGSAEFQLELDPSMSTWTLVEKVLRAKAPPLLAPGMMLQLGLLGLAYIYSDARDKKKGIT